MAEDIVNYCVENGYAEDGDIAGAAEAWGFEVAKGGSIEDFAKALSDGYGADVNGMVGTEAASVTVEDLFPNLADYSIGIETGDSAATITGIQRIDDYNCRIHATQVDANLIYQLGFQICPLHYYGDAKQFNAETGPFGFPKGDLSLIRAKTTQPMGAGPYKFIKFENGIINFEANEHYFKGAPKIKYLQFREVQDVDKLNGVVTGTIDVTDPSWSKDTAQAVADENGGDITGDVITTSTVDNLGYGYIGMNSHNVCVNDEPASDASKCLRKGLATILAAYRDVAIDSYYGEAAEVINYPISNTSWAAPRPSDEGYKNAYSTAVDGTPIYTDDMSEEDKYAAAGQAALAYLEAAGYTVADGKVTAAPEGAKMSYEVIIPGQGQQDHPAYGIAVKAKEILESIGMELTIADVGTSIWSSQLEANTAELWAGAWQSTADPDMYQVYHSSNADGNGTNSNHYQVKDSELDEIIVEARSSADNTFRKAAYKEALEIILSWGAELPLYQRKDGTVLSTARVNVDTLPQDMTPYYGWAAEIQNLELN